MIISDKHQCIFIRVPKNASTSIEHELIVSDPHCVLSDESLPPYGHQLASEVRAIAGEDKWNEYFKFAVFREPESRYLSTYVYNKDYRFPHHQRLHWLLDENKSFPDPEDKVIDKHMFVRMHAYNTYYCEPSGAYQQIDWLDEEGIYVASMDNLQREWQLICDKIQLPHRKLPRYNTSQSNDYTLDIDARMLMMMMYKEDFNYYKTLWKGNNQFTGT